MTYNFAKKNPERKIMGCKSKITAYRYFPPFYFTHAEINGFSVIFDGNIRSHFFQ